MNTANADNAPHILVHTSIQPIRWGDMDALGHVNNTVYFRYMEQARVEWLEKVTTLSASLSPLTEEGMVIINAHCTFLAQLTYPGQVTVDMFIGAVGKSSVMSHYRLYKVGEERLYAEGSAKIVWANYKLGKSAPLPPFIRALLPPESSAS